MRLLHNSPPQYRPSHDEVARPERSGEPDRRFHHVAQGMVQKPRGYPGPDQPRSLHGTMGEGCDQGALTGAVAANDSEAKIYELLTDLLLALAFGGLDLEIDQAFAGCQLDHFIKRRNPLRGKPVVEPGPRTQGSQFGKCVLADETGAARRPVEIRVVEHNDMPVGGQTHVTFDGIGSVADCLTE